MGTWAVWNSVTPVTPREGRVSRNLAQVWGLHGLGVTPREGRVSRNSVTACTMYRAIVTPREGRVSRNGSVILLEAVRDGHAP